MRLSCNNYECIHEDNNIERWCECYEIQPNMDVDCPNFKINNTYRWCKHSKLAYTCYWGDLDFEEDFKCNLDDNIYECYTKPYGQFYPCKIGKFELDEDL